MKSRAETPERFRPSKSVLAVDSAMTGIIRAGGILVVSAVLGIFVFIAIQITPLFFGAAVHEMDARNAGNREYQILALDEWAELPILVDSSGEVFLLDLKADGEATPVDIPFAEKKEITASTYLSDKEILVFGTADGQFSFVQVSFKRDFAGDGKVTATFEPSDWFAVGEPEERVEKIAFNQGPDQLLAAAILSAPDGTRRVRAATLTQKRTLLGAGKLDIGDRFDLTEDVHGNPNQILVNRNADGLIVAAPEGEVESFQVSGKKMELQQRFTPFADQADPALSSVDFVFGDVSLIVTNPEGLNRTFSLFVPVGGRDRQFGQTKTFPQLPGGATVYAHSQRNKGFLIGSGTTVSLRYNTTESVRWESTLDFKPVLAAISGKNDRFALLDDAGKIHFFELDDPHPETSFRALFGKIWYEGASEPQFSWQSTGGSDDFEPKLSMVPLLIGTLKGTLYAMVFALPIALLAAIYTSQFLNPDLRRAVKPTMEIMASLPSVVLGFLAALWLAPILDTRVPSVLCLVIALPVTAGLLGWAISHLPIQWRRFVAPGFEFVFFLPVFAVVAVAAWMAGPVIESMFFVVADPQTGAPIADFRRWWPEATGTPFEQRNSLVVGFVMGFAVIPIIFTISEDAMSNVPPTLRAGSLALGASRWQTARNVILPTAAPGIFSAVMIGLGRAVGETMIVVMATGNTPIMDLNIFSGMRTLSANIAVELPEAPHHGTLYRTLFLGAMLLFLLTFAVNTVAEVMRQHLREKFKTV